MDVTGTYLRENMDTIPIVSNYNLYPARPIRVGRISRIEIWIACDRLEILYLILFQLRREIYITF